MSSTNPNAVLAEYETDTQRLTLDISAQATSKFGFTFQDRVITPKGVATVIGVLETTLGAAPKLFVLYEGEPFVKPVDATLEEMKTWTKLADSTNAASASMVDTREYHNLRQVTVFGQRKVIVMQSANGPCPVIALANVLLLRGELPSIEKLSCGRQDAVVTANQLQQAVLEYITSASSSHPTPQFSESAREDGTLALFVKSPAFEQLRQRLKDPREGPRTMQRFYDGLFVEPIHDVIDGFASSEDAALFALANVKVVHGWLMDFESEKGEDLQNLRTQSYSELQVAATMGDEQPKMSAAAAEFLKNSQTQLTELGLMVLSTELQDHEYMVMFRNNHFSVVVADKGKLYTLVTDVAFTQRNDVVLQEVKVNDDGEFVDGAAEELEPVVKSALEKFEGRYNVEQIRKAVEGLMQRPNDLFLMAIQEQIDGPKQQRRTSTNSNNNNNQVAVVQGQVLNADAAAASSSANTNNVQQQNNQNILQGQTN